MSESRPRVIILGAGFGGLETAFHLRMRVGDQAAVTLVADAPEFRFTPNTIYVPFGKPPERYVVPLEEAFRKKSITFVRGRATSIDTAAKRVRVGDDELAYDHLVVATGARTRPDEVPGLAEHGIDIWSSAHLLRLRGALQRLVERAWRGERQRVAFLVLPHNKCAGPLYELAMMLDTWLRREGARDKVDVSYVTSEETFLHAFGPRMHEAVEKEFADRGIHGQLARVATRVDAESVAFEEGAALGFDLLLSAPPYEAAQRFEALALDARGFARADPRTRQAVGHEDVYVVGDASDFPVKQAFLALLEADTAAEHLSRRILGESVEGVAFDPVSMCIMEQFDKATFAQVPLEVEGDVPRVRAGAHDLYKLGTGEVWRVGKKMIGTVLPMRFRAGEPFHAGATWATMEAGLKMMSAAFAR